MKQRLILLAALVGAVALFSALPVYADTLSDAQSAKQQAESNLNSTNNDISYIESQQEELQDEIGQVDAELFQVLLDLDICETDLTNKRAEIAQTESDLADAKETESEQYNAMKKRIHWMYQNGDTSFFDSLLGADSFADVLNKVENFNDVYDYDRDLLVEYQNTKIEISNLLSQLQEEESELTEIQDEYLQQQDSLESLKQEKQNELDDYDTQLAEAEALAEKYKSTITAQNEIIAEEIAKQQAAAAAKVTAGSSTQTAGTASGTTSSTSSTATTSTAATTSSTSTIGSSTTTTTTTTVATSSIGAAAASYACQFVGNPYVWGGTSLTNGADCSGFVMAVFAQYGISLPHSSYAMASCGTEVSAADIQPGDIVCYGGHVAIYIGGGAIVHASNERDGIKISSNYAYRSIVSIRRLG